MGNLYGVYIVNTSHPAQSKQWQTIQQLIVLTDKEVDHLQRTTSRIRACHPNLKWIEMLETHITDSEMLDAFVTRFGRLQDTLGDKLLPALLRVTLEPTGSQLDNLSRAEKMGWLSSSDQWIEIRMLRNRLIHEYMRSASDLLEALQIALSRVDLLCAVQKNLKKYIAQFIVVNEK